MPGFFLALLQSLPPNEAVAKSPACLATDGALKLRELRNARSQELEGTMNLQTRTGVALPPVTSPVVPPASLRERRGESDSSLQIHPGLRRPPMEPARAPVRLQRDA